jgi:hypothetical protein
MQAEVDALSLPRVVTGKRPTAHACFAGYPMLSQTFALLVPHHLPFRPKMKQGPLKVLQTGLRRLAPPTLQAQPPHFRGRQMCWSEEEEGLWWVENLRIWRCHDEKLEIESETWLITIWALRHFKNAGLVLMGPREWCLKQYGSPTVSLEAGTLIAVRCGNGAQTKKPRSCKLFRLPLFLFLSSMILVENHGEEKVTPTSPNNVAVRWQSQPTKQPIKLGRRNPASTEE